MLVEELYTWLKARINRHKMQFSGFILPMMTSILLQVKPTIACFSKSYLDVFKKWFKIIWMIDYSDGEIIPKVGNWADVTNYR